MDSISSMSSGGGDIILRAEIPEVGIKKALRIPRNSSIRSIVQQLQAKANLDNSFVQSCRLFKPWNSPDSDKSQEDLVSEDLELGDWLDDDVTLEKSGLNWKNNDVVQLRRFGRRSLMMNSMPDEKSLKHHHHHNKAAANSVNNIEDINGHGPVGTLFSGTSQTFKKLGKIAQKNFNSNRKNNGKDLVSQDIEGSIRKMNPRSPSFGADLKYVPKSNSGIPLVAVKIVDYLKANDMETEGLFRLSGAASAVSSVKEHFNSSGGNVDLRQIPNIDGHTLAGVLKSFLRELPEPLLTFKLYDCWVAAHYSVDPLIRQFYFHHLVRALPEDNFSLLKYLCEFFNDLSKYGDVNKMTLQNIALVVGPNIMKHPSESASHMVFHTGAVNEIVLFLIRNVHSIFLPAQEYLKHAQIQPIKGFTGLVRALYEFSPTSQSNSDLSRENLTELSFDQDDLFFVHDIGNNGIDADGWWVAELFGKKTPDRKIGLIPSNYVEVIHQYEEIVDMTDDEIKDTDSESPFVEIIEEKHTNSSDEEPVRSLEDEARPIEDVNVSQLYESAPKGPEILKSDLPKKTEISELSKTENTESATGSTSVDLKSVYLENQRLKGEVGELKIKVDNLEKIVVELINNMHK